MTIEQMQLVILVIDCLLVPAMVAVARLLWRTERRLLKIELRLGIVEEH